MDQAQLRDLAERLKLREMLSERRRNRPDEWYTPSSPGSLRHDGTHNSQYANQLAFHLSRHPIRALFPGNGWGKTSAAAAEVNAWVMHTNRWQQTPKWPIEAIWIPQDFGQFAKLRPQLETESFARGWKWNDSKSVYTWPGGDRLWVYSTARSWTNIQGINPDLVVFDEQPPEQLWIEMMYRRRGRRDTRFILAATATQGITWMYDEVYLPWLTHHEAMGIDHERALLVQSHPRIWCWDRGGIADNPSVTEDQRRWYADAPGTPGQKQVRLFGGFRAWVEDPVFDDAAMTAIEAESAEWHRENAAIVGGLYALDEDRSDAYSQP